MEIDLGLPAHAGVVEMMRYVLGSRIAEQVLFAGQNYPAQKALEVGLLDELVEADQLLARAIEQARLLGEKPPLAYRALKRFARQGIVARMRELDAGHADELVAIWFAEETQRLLTGAVERLTKRTPPAAQA